MLGCGVDDEPVLRHWRMVAATLHMVGSSPQQRGVKLNHTYAGLGSSPEERGGKLNHTFTCPEEKAKARGATEHEFEAATAVPKSVIPDSFDVLEKIV